MHDRYSELYYGTDDLKQSDDFPRVDSIITNVNMTSILPLAVALSLTGSLTEVLAQDASPRFVVTSERV